MGACMRACLRVCMCVCVYDLLGQASADFNIDLKISQKFNFAKFLLEGPQQVLNLATDLHRSISLRNLDIFLLTLAKAIPKVSRKFSHKILSVRPKFFLQGVKSIETSRKIIALCCFL